MKSSGGVTITQKMHGVEKFGVAMDQVKSWILEYVVEPNANLNGFPPCPYAKQAMLENKVRFLETTNIKMFLEKANQEVDTWDDSVDVCVFIFTKMPNASLLEQEVRVFNRAIAQRDFVVLEDHPHNVENINGAIMNQGDFALCLLQRLSKIQSASKALKKRGYYSVWSEENLDDVVNWRDDLV